MSKPGTRSSRKLRVLVTAGPTREYIDSVRYLSNDSSGRMGIEIAQAGVRAGHEVVLVHGPIALPTPEGARAVAVGSAAEMLAACRRHWRKCDVLIMAAAVADYTPARRSPVKLKKSTDALLLKLTPTVDILKTLSAARRPGQAVIGFALEDRRGRTRAKDKLVRKQLDAIVLNAPSAIGGNRSEVEVLTRNGTWEMWPQSGKAAHAARLVRLAERLVYGANPTVAKTMR